jgi:hypothetical protein
MQVEHTYNKADVLQALRYHFITRREIRLMVILVNVFAFVSAGLFFFHKISPMAFLISSLLWFSMMFMFWLCCQEPSATPLSGSLYLGIQDNHMSIQNEQGSNQGLA